MYKNISYNKLYLSKMKFHYSNLRSQDATTVLNTCVSLPLQNPEVLFDPFKFVFHTVFFLQTLSILFYGVNYFCWMFR